MFSPDGELNPGLPNGRPETKPLCHMASFFERKFFINTITKQSNPNKPK